jgi:hypothetical protein
MPVCPVFAIGLEGKCGIGGQRPQGSKGPRSAACSRGADLRDHKELKNLIFGQRPLCAPQADIPSESAFDSSQTFRRGLGETNVKVVDYINQDVSGGSLLVELASPFWEVILNQPTRVRLVATFISVARSTEEAKVEFEKS